MPNSVFIIIIIVVTAKIWNGPLTCILHKILGYDDGVMWFSKLCPHYIVQSTCQTTQGHNIYIQDVSFIVTPRKVVLHKQQ